MATKYSDIIRLRSGKAAYSITDEKKGEWTSFIPNEQFNAVLRTVLKSVRGNSIDNHKSFWINGTYGTGKSHAVSVISHLLGDEVSDIKEWVDYEYGDEKFQSIRQAIYSLRQEKRLLTVKLYGLEVMNHPLDLALVLQHAVTEALDRKGLKIEVQTDFENYIRHIEQNPNLWEQLISGDKELPSIASTPSQLIENLRGNDVGTFHKISNALRNASLDIRLDNSNMKQWLLDVQNKLTELGTYNGLLIVWDEFTDVMTNAIGIPVLKELQELVETLMNIENNSYFFLISHPSAFNKLGSEQLKQTDGRYFRMKYNMEPVSAFKIMSRKFEIIDKERHTEMCNQFYTLNPQLLELFTSASNDMEETRQDLFNLFPLHPGTAHLATFYATVVGSSSRSVFEFLGQNDAIVDFLNSEETFLNRDTITADYLWDYVLKVFQENVSDFGAVTERFNSYKQLVSNEGEEYMVVFKGVLLLNAFNNVAAENNNGLVTPSVENIKNLFAGTRYENSVDEVLDWFNKEGVIQRAPGGLYSVQFSALPSGEIEEKMTEMRQVQFRYTYQILRFSDTAATAFKSKFMQKVIRPYSFDFFSDVQNEAQLRNQIKKGRRQTKNSALYLALLFGKNNEEVAKLKDFAEKCAEDENDKDLKNIVFVVFDSALTDQNYDMFIEFQANYACASSHGFLDQQAVHREHAIEMVKEWMDAAQRGNAIIFINGNDSQSISVRHLSSVVNSSVVPMIFPYGPDAIDILRQKAPNTFWRQQNSKEIVRAFLLASSKADFDALSSQMRPVQYLIQDCLDDNLNWKPDVPEGHPFKVVYDKVNSIIKHADKSLPFNFDDKFSHLTKPPYGLYSSFAAMAMVAFALRPWDGKIFDQQGKPRDKNALVGDIYTLFKVWDEGKSNNKLNFKFQTPEEGKLCKSLVSLFKLNSSSNAYSDVSSLKDARYAITADFLGKKNAPLWSIKYAPDVAFKDLPITITITKEIKQLTDDIVEICQESDLRNPALVTETLQLIDEQRFEMKNILNVDAAFSEGFNNFLESIEFVNIKDDEIEDARKFIEQNLQSTVGYWTEEEVVNAAKNWRLSKSSPEPPTPPVKPTQPVGTGVSDPNILEEKRNKAKNRIKAIGSLDEAKTLLSRLCDECGEWLLDKINS